MKRSESELDSLVEFDRQPVVAYVEIDRFCDGCGYNLRTQPVRREARTGLLLCRCPECGSFQPARDSATAGRAWLRRLGTLALFIWILVILWTGFGLGAAQVGLTLVPLEEFTTYRQSVITRPVPPLPTLSSLPAGLRAQTITVTTQGSVSVTRTTTWQREVRENVEYYTEFIALLRGSSFALGFVLAMLAAVVFHHWRRWGYFVVVTVVTVAAGVLVWCIWRNDQPHLLDWATPHILAQAAAHFAGGLAGILLGRPFARLIVTLTLPPKIRQVLAFLWLADGKQPPAVAAPP